MRVRNRTKGEQGTRDRKKKKYLWQPKLGGKI